MPAPIFRNAPGAKLGLVTIGGCHAACIEALDLLRSDGVALDYMRVRGFPFGAEVTKFLEAHEINFIVEQNRDGQLRSLIMLETGVPIEQAGIGAVLRRIPDERESRDCRRSRRSSRRRHDLHRQTHACTTRRSRRTRSA